MTQLTLGSNFENLQIKKVTFIKSLSSENELVIGFPSFTRKDMIHYCHYLLPKAGNDYCSCEGDIFKKCWHVKYRPLILKLFLNREPNWNFIEQFETYGAWELDQICHYILELFKTKSSISALDLADLPIERSTRRIIGSAFLRLQKQGIIYKNGIVDGDSKTHGRYMALWKINSKSEYKMAIFKR